jgi:hypothetical protein
MILVFGFGTQDVQKMRKKRDVKGLIKVLEREKDSGIRTYAAEALGDLKRLSERVAVWIKTNPKTIAPIWLNYQHCQSRRRVAFVAPKS